MIGRSEWTMRFGIFAAAATSLLVFADANLSPANAETRRLECSGSDGGVPNKFEIDDVRHTVLEFEGNGSTDDPIEADDQATKAAFTKSWIKWTDAFDGQKYSIERSTGTLKKTLLDGTVLYTKTCTTLAPGAA